MISIKCPLCDKRMRKIVARVKPQAGEDGVLRDYRLYECTADKTLLTVETPVAVSRTAKELLA